MAASAATGAPVWANAPAPAAAPAATERASAEPKLWADEEDEFAELRARVTRSYIFEERCADAVRCKEAGNALLNEGEFEEASAKYEEGLFHVDFDDFQRAELLDEHRALLQRARLPLLLNSVLCALRMNPAEQPTRLVTAEARCAEALAIEPHNAKARFRRAQLHARAGEDERALALLEALCTAHPAERAFRAELHAHAERMRHARKASDAFWAKALKRQAAHADAGGGGGAPAEQAARDADDEPCLTSGRGPLSARERAGHAAADAAALPLSGPLVPLLAALRGVSLIGSTLWGWCAQLVWAESARGVATAAAATHGAGSKRDD
ncbi:hypothetical protein KFE25_012837 [Diacronema lutheri]|uniref:Uncharacterized protein n=1 Tax=Diacronema lutheri TaxID=2081491 RepID=A0A8J6C271_DIALT|nr:hypothetical protein KFE25_012837 [Diacronema lutheri]